MFKMKLKRKNILYNSEIGSYFESFKNLSNEIIIYYLFNLKDTQKNSSCNNLKKKNLYIRKVIVRNKFNLGK